jgi:GDPmannose 4,6-dehydratase
VVKLKMKLRKLKAITQTLNMLETIGQEVVSIDKRYYRPAEVELLIGDPTKAKTQLNWRPKYDLPMIVKEMVAADMEIFKRDRYLKEGGHTVMNYHE